MTLKIKPKPVADEDVSFSQPVLDTPTPPIGLVTDTLNNYHVETHRGSKHTVKSYFLHVSDVIRASPSHKFCAREQALMLIEDRGASRIRQLPPGMALIHTIGHAVQHHIVRDFIARSPHRDKVWGDWVCTCGDTKTCFRFKEQAKQVICHKCAGACTNYAEVSIAWGEYNISGHPDLLIVWNNVIHIYEIKTIDRKDVDFATLDAPLGDHTLQATMYYWIMKAIQKSERDTLKKHPNAFNPAIPYEIDPYLRYIYCDRSARLFMRDFYKEFVKRASPYSRIEPMLNNAKAVKDALVKKVLPDRLSLCSGISTPRAKNCKCAVSCFQRIRNTINV